jgi:MFS family permease
MRQTGHGGRSGCEILQAVKGANTARTEDATGKGVLSTAAMAAFLIALDSSLLNVGFPAIKESFPATSTASAAWIINIYSVVLAALLVPAGFLADRWGGKSLLVLGLSVFLAGSIACATAIGIGQLLFSRCLQAIGGALSLPASLAVVLGHFHGRGRAIAVGKWTAAGGLAAALGPPLGSILMRLGSWRLMFFLHIPLCAWALLRSRHVLYNSRGPTTSTKIAMALPAIGGGTGMLVATFAVVPRPWGLFMQAGILMTAAMLVGLGLWIACREQKFMRNFGRREIVFTWTTTICFGSVFGAMFLVYDLALVYHFHINVARAALLLGPIPLLSVPVARSVAALQERWSPRAVLAAGNAMLVLAGLSFFQLLNGIDLSQMKMTWTTIILFSSGGIGLCFPTLNLAAVKGVAADCFGLGTALNQSCRHMGGVLGVAAASWVMTTAAPDPVFRTSYLLICLSLAGIGSTIMMYPASPKFAGVGSNSQVTSSDLEAIVTAAQYHSSSSK